MSSVRATPMVSMPSTMLIIISMSVMPARSPTGRESFERSFMGLAFLIGGKHIRLHAVSGDVIGHGALAQHAPGVPAKFDADLHHFGRIAGRGCPRNRNNADGSRASDAWSGAVCKTDWQIGGVELGIPIEEPEAFHLADHDFRGAQIFACHLDGPDTRGHRG